MEIIKPKMKLSQNYNSIAGLWLKMGVWDFPNFRDGKFRKYFVRVLESESRKSLKKSDSRKFGFPIFRDRDPEIPKNPKFEEAIMGRRETCGGAE